MPWEVQPVSSGVGYWTPVEAGTVKAGGGGEALWLLWAPLSTADFFLSIIPKPAKA